MSATAFRPVVTRQAVNDVIELLWLAGDIGEQSRVSGRARRKVAKWIRDAKLSVREQEIRRA